MIANLSYSAQITLTPFSGASFNQQNAAVTGRGFKMLYTSGLKLSPSGEADVTGGSFYTYPDIKYLQTPTFVITGAMFRTTPHLHSATSVAGAMFGSKLVSTLVSRNECWATGTGFDSSSALITALGTSGQRVKGRGFLTKARSLGGGRVVGATVKTTAHITAVPAANALAAITGATFSTQAASTLNLIYSIRTTGRGFKSILERGAVVGSTFSSVGASRLTVPIVMSEAFVMNELNKGVSRYTGFDFLGIVQGFNGMLGITSTGVYQLQRGYDSGAVIPTSLTTREWDFGDDYTSGFTSKNIPVVYLNSDSETSVTSIVDGVAMPAQPSDFGGRRCKLARGARGRYWAFRIDNFQKLQGIEMLPERLQRRVK